MSSNCNLVSDSQNFMLRLSEGSTYIEDTQDLVATDKTEDKDDIIVISDSSCSSSPRYTSRPESKSSSTSNTKNKKRIEYKKLDFLDSSSENEKEKFSSPWRMLVRSNIKSSDKYINKSSVQVNKVFYTSDETTSSSDISYDRNRINRFDIKKSYKSPTSTLAKSEINSRVREKYNVEERNKIIMPSNAICSDNPNVFTRLNKLPTYNTPYKDNTGKIRLTKQDTHKILNNIKSTQVMYNSPREKKEANVIINESTDIDEDVIHPAISPTYNRKIKDHSDRPEIIGTSLEDNIPDSQTDLSKPFKTHIGKSSDMTRKEDLYQPLSERKKKQIAEWLMGPSSDSLSDSSCSNIPLTIRNSRGSGNSSLERLELKYETPNNRWRINREQGGEKQATIINSDKAKHQTTLDKYYKKSKDNNLKFCTSDKPKLSPKVYSNKKVSSSVLNTPKNIDIMDCADVLDKLYGKSWRDKAKTLLPTTEPRKAPIQAINRVIQTERKAVSKNKYYATDSNSDELDNINVNRKKNIPRKQKKVDSFINDTSSSSSNSESEIYHTALTNLRTSTNSTMPKPMPVSASAKRLQAICDSDTDSESSKTSSDFKRNLGRKRLSFSDDENSDTSEFEPGDCVPPKYIHRKEINKATILQPLKGTPRFESTTTVNKSVRYKSFLLSLSDQIPMNNVHPDAKKYRLDYKNNKEELCKELYKLYNVKVFDNKMPSDMLIEWNIRMRGTAGFCYNKKTTKSLAGTVKSSRIVLATKILDSPDRLRDTLIHEMCHAAAWLLNDVSDGHGPFWTAWANKAMKTFPELPPIRRCHDYKIKTKFTYRCTSCGYSIGRHSKSLDIEKKRCGYCFGKFELLVNKTTKSGTVQVQTPKREPTGFALYVKQNYNSVKREKINMKHADVMKILGQQFSAIKIANKNELISN